MNQIKVGKLAIIASNTCNFISKLLQGTKIMVVSCSTVQKFHWLFCVGNLDLDLKTEFVLQVSRKIANEEMGAATVNFH